MGRDRRAEEEEREEEEEGEEEERLGRDGGGGDHLPRFAAHRSGRRRSVQAALSGRAFEAGGESGSSWWKWTAVGGGRVCSRAPAVEGSKTSDEEDEQRKRNWSDFVRCLVRVAADAAVTAREKSTGASFVRF